MGQPSRLVVVKRQASPLVSSTFHLVVAGCAERHEVSFAISAALSQLDYVVSRGCFLQAHKTEGMRFQRVPRVPPQFGNMAKLLTS